MSTPVPRSTNHRALDLGITFLDTADLARIDEVVPSGWAAGDGYPDMAGVRGLSPARA